MKRRSFLSLLFAAAVTPPLLAREVIEPRLPKKLPPREFTFTIHEEIGISICNVSALQRVKFHTD